MPTVPRYNQPQLKDQALPGARVTTDAPKEAFGGGPSTEALGKAASGLAGQVVDYGQEVKKQADDLATTEAYEKTVRLKLDLFYNPQTGAYNRKGKDALGAHEEYQKQFETGADEIEKSLANDDQRAMYKRIRSQQGLELDGSLQRHTFGEIQRFDEETTKASIATQREDAVLNFHVPGKVDQSVKTQREMIEANGYRQGKSRDVIDLEIKEAESQTHTAIINRMLANGQDMTAKSYYTKYKGALDAKDVTSVERALEDGTMRGESQRASDAIMREYSDLGAAREAVKQIKDPKLRDAVDDRVRSEFGFREKEATVFRGKNFMEVYSLLENTKKQKGVVHYEDIPINRLGAMTPDQRDAARALVKRLNAPGEHAHSDSVFLKYYGLPEQSLAGVSEAELVEKVRPNVNDSAWSKITTKWQAVRDAKDKPDKAHEVKSMYTDEEMVLHGLRSTGTAGINQADTLGELYKSEEKSAAYNTFRDQVNQAWQAWAFDNGNKMPNAVEKKKIIDKLILEKVFVKKTRFGLDALASDTEKPLAALTDEERGSSYVPMEKIPPSSLAAIRKYAKDNNYTLDADKIQRAYAASLMGNDALIEQILKGK
jgi:hypothetical protein